MINRAKSGDLRDLLELYTHLHDNPVPPDTVALRRLWRGILRNRSHHVVVAREGGRIVSSCVAVIIPNLTHGQRPYALVENVITHPDFRGRGLATACLDEAERLAREAGCYKIMLMTGSKDPKTLAFYERAGYNRTDKTAFIQWLS